MKEQTNERSKLRNIEKQTSNAHWRFPLRRVTNIADHKQCNNVSSEFSSTTQYKYNEPYNGCEEAFRPDKLLQEGMTPSTFQESNLSVLSFNCNSNYTRNELSYTKCRSNASCPKRQATSSCQKRQLNSSYQKGRSNYSCSQSQFRDDSSRLKPQSYRDFSCCKPQYSISNYSGFCQQICDSQLPRDNFCLSSSTTEIEFSVSSSETSEYNYSCQKHDEAPVFTRQKNDPLPANSRYTFSGNKYSEPDLGANCVYKDHLNSPGTSLKICPYQNSPKYTSQYENCNETSRHVNATDPNYHCNKQFCHSEFAISEKSRFSTSPWCESPKQNCFESPSRYDAAKPDYCLHKKNFDAPVSKSPKRGKFPTCPKYYFSSQNSNDPSARPDGAWPDYCRYGAPASKSLERSKLPTCPKYYFFSQNSNDSSTRPDDAGLDYYRYKKRFDPSSTRSPEKGVFPTSPEPEFAKRNYNNSPIHPDAIWPEHYRYRKRFDPIATKTPQKDEFLTIPKYVESPSQVEQSKKDSDFSQTTSLERGEFLTSTEYSEPKEGAKPAVPGPTPKQKNQAPSIDLSLEKEALQTSTEPTLPTKNTSEASTNAESKSGNASYSDYNTNKEGYFSVDTSSEICEYVSSSDFESESLAGAVSNSENSASTTDAISNSENSESTTDAISNSESSKSTTDAISNSESSKSTTDAISNSESVSKSRSPDKKAHLDSKLSGLKEHSFSPSTDYTVVNENESRPFIISDQPPKSAEDKFLDRKMGNSDKKRKKAAEANYPSENVTEETASIKSSALQKLSIFSDARDYSSNPEDSHPSAPENKYKMEESSAPTNTDISQTSKLAFDNTSENLELCTCEIAKQNKFCTCKNSEIKLPNSSPKPVNEEKKVATPSKSIRKCLDLDEFDTNCSTYEECHQCNTSCPEAEYCLNYDCRYQNSSCVQSTCGQTACAQSASAQSVCALSACGQSACARSACVDNGSSFCFKRLSSLENTSRPPKSKFQPTKIKKDDPKSQPYEKSTEIYETAKECQKSTQTHKDTSTECNCSLSNRTNVETCCCVKTPSSSDKYEFASSCLRKGKKCKTPTPVPRKKITPVPRLRASSSGSDSYYNSNWGNRCAQSSDSLICNLSDSTCTSSPSSCFTAFRSKSSSSLVSASTSSSDSSSTVSSCEKLSPTPSGCRPCRWLSSPSSCPFQYKPEQKRYNYCFKKRKRRRKEPHLLSTTDCSLKNKRFLKNKKRRKNNAKAIRLCARKASLKEMQRRRNKARALARQIRPKDKKFYCLW